MRQGVLTVEKGQNMKAGVLQRLERRCGRQKTAQYNRTGNTDALALQIKFSEGVLAQRDERNAAEVGQNCVLEDDLGQLLSAVSNDVVEPDTAQDKSRTSNVRGY